MIQEQVCDFCKEKGNTDPSSCTSCINLHRAYAKSMGKPDPQPSYEVSCTYSYTTGETIQFPLYKTWDDVEDWYIKWHTLHFVFKGETIWGEIPLTMNGEIGETKRPSFTTISTEDYEQELESR